MLTELLLLTAMHFSVLVGKPVKQRALRFAVQDFLRLVCRAFARMPTFSPVHWLQLVASFPDKYLFTLQHTLIIES